MQEHNEQHVSVSPRLAQREEQSVCIRPHSALAWTGYAQKLIDPSGNYLRFPSFFQSPIKKLLDSSMIFPLEPSMTHFP